MVVCVQIVSVLAVNPGDHVAAWELCLTTTAQHHESTVKEKELVNALKAMLGIYAKVKLVAPKSIARSEGKAVRIIDNRKLY